MPDEKQEFRFDIDSSKSDYTTSVQSFNRIRDIRAVDGMVLVLVDEKRQDEGVQSAKLKPVLMSVREAAERAIGLNRMINKFPGKSDKDTAHEIVEATVAACKEAQRQKLDRRVAKKAKHVGYTHNPKDILEAAFPKEARWTETLAKQKGVTVEEMRRDQLSDIASKTSYNIKGSRPPSTTAN